MLTCSPLSTFSPIPQKVVKANSVTLNSDTAFQLREKQYRMMKLVLAYYQESLEALKEGADIEDLVNLPVREDIGRYKYTEEGSIQPAYEAVRARLKEELTALKAGRED